MQEDPEDHPEALVGWTFQVDEHFFSEEYANAHPNEKYEGKFTKFFFKGRKKTPTWEYVFPPDDQVYYVSDYDGVKELINWEAPNVPEVVEEEVDEVEPEEEEEVELLNIVESSEMESSDTPSDSEEDSGTDEWTSCDDWSADSEDEYPNASKPDGLPDSPKGLTPLQVFLMFIPLSFFSLITEQTNLYKAQERPASLRTVADFTVDEITTWFGMLIFAALVNLPRLDLYWNVAAGELDGPFKLPDFKSLMSRNRFYYIKQYIHIADNYDCVPKDHDEYDPLFKLRLVVLLTYLLLLIITTTYFDYYYSDDAASDYDF